ncbi:MAG: bifunctional oligoribonuclease/PAP phosphatase NrnA [Phototrophicaceae bacterium]
MNKPPEWQAAIDAITAAHSILIVTHLRPDGDAMGSSLGLGNALKKQGKAVTIAVDLGTPEFFSWLPGSDTVVPSLDAGSWDLMISTDASDEERSGDVGIYGRANSKQVINIDHHRTNTYFGDIHLVIPTAASASQIVVTLWEKMGIEWDSDIAQPLITGLVTDTLGFRTNSTTPQELATAQRLMEYGGSLSEATYRSLGVMSSQELLLWKNILPTVELHGDIAEATIRREDMLAVGLDYIDTGNIVGFLRGVNNVRIAVVFREDPDNIVKVSLRSDPGYDVSDVAFQLGGGGHKQASGADFKGTVAECRALILPMLQEALSKGSLQLD